jgi:hypothetical protein
LRQRQQATKRSTIWLSSEHSQLVERPDSQYRRAITTVVRNRAIRTGWKTRFVQALRAAPERYR